MEDLITRFLDEDGRVKQWPKKMAAKQAVLNYFWARFEDGRDYSEQEVNALVGSLHTFGDHTMLRRALVESGLIGRVPDGSRYWKNPDPAQQ